MQRPHAMIVLGLETSCDETAAGVVDGDRILSNVVRTQFDLHGPYGGVVPELASRRHVEVVLPVAEEALSRAGLTLAGVDGLAVTQGPGLVGALLVGLNFAKGLAMVTGLPLVGVNHLYAHAACGFLMSRPRFPTGAMVVSGGHTNLYVIRGPLDFELKGRTRDDAAGEAYDKVAKLLGLGYPGGKVIDDLAEKGDPRRYDFPRPMLKQGLDFSFAGLKTAVMNLVRTEFGDKGIKEGELADVAASFQAAAVEVLTRKMEALLVKTRVKAFILAGGVAANRGLRREAARAADRVGVELVLPPPELCTDNGAMIAGLGRSYLEAGRVIDLTADAYSRWPGKD